LHRLVSAVTHDPSIVLDGIQTRMSRLARQQRFEEAAEVRERGARLEKALLRMIGLHSLLDAGDIILGIGERAVLVRRGRVAAATFIVTGDIATAVAQLKRGAGDATEPVTSAEVRAEMSVVAAWLARHADEVRLLAASGSWVSPARARPCTSFAPRATKN
jgi:DNA polymerase-3 subunit epsilon